MSRLLTKRERIDLRHYLQVLTEQARAVRNAIEPDTGKLAITVEAWVSQWAALTRDLDSVTDRITGPAAKQDTAVQAAAEVLLRDYEDVGTGPPNLAWQDFAPLARAALEAARKASHGLGRKVMSDERTPEEAARDEAERTGNWPEGHGPFHRHFCSNAVHRDGGPECDQPGTPRRVYVFDPDYLSEHEAFITRRTAAEAGVTFEGHRWYTIVRQGGKFLRAFASGEEFSGLGEFDDEEEFERWRKG